MATVIRREGGIGLEVFKLRVAELKKLKLIVGWLSSAKYDDNTPVAGVAAVQEYGSTSRGIPPRPFMRTTQDNKREEWKRIVESGVRAILNGSATAFEVMEQLGAKVVADIKITISNISLPLSPVTIALRKIRDDGSYNIGGKLVGQVAAAIAAGETGPGQLGDQSYANKDPLRDTGVMIATLTHEVQS